MTLFLCWYIVYLPIMIFEIKKIFVCRKCVIYTFVSQKKVVSLHFLRRVIICCVWYTQQNYNNYYKQQLCKLK